MKVVLVDSAYFGDALSHARQNARINRRHACWAQQQNILVNTKVEKC